MRSRAAMDNHSGSGRGIYDELFGQRLEDIAILFEDLIVRFEGLTDVGAARGNPISSGAIRDPVELVPLAEAEAAAHLRGNCRREGAALGTRLTLECALHLSFLL
jgi:hypothetical protein